MQQFGFLVLQLNILYPLTANILSYNNVSLFGCDIR